MKRIHSKTYLILFGSLASQLNCSDTMRQYCFFTTAVSILLYLRYLYNALYTVSEKVVHRVFFSFIVSDRLLRDEMVCSFFILSVTLISS